MRLIHTELETFTKVCSYFQDLSFLKWELLFCCIRVRRHRNRIIVKESHKYSNAIIFDRGF